MAAINAPDLVAGPDGQLLVVWTQDNQVRFGVGCRRGFFVDPPVEEHTLPGVVQSTERGQPSIAVDDRGLVHLVYTLTTEDGTTSVRWATRTIPTCGTTNELEIPDPAVQSGIAASGPERKS